MILVLVLLLTPNAASAEFTCSLFAGYVLVCFKLVRRLGLSQQLESDFDFVKLVRRAWVNTAKMHSGHI